MNLIKDAQGKPQINKHVKLTQNRTLELNAIS